MSKLDPSFHWKTFFSLAKRTNRSLVPCLTAYTCGSKYLNVRARIPTAINTYKHLCTLCFFFFLLLSFPFVSFFLLLLLPLLAFLFLISPVSSLYTLPYIFPFPIYSSGAEAKQRLIERVERSRKIKSRTLAAYI